MDRVGLTWRDGSNEAAKWDDTMTVRRIVANLPAGSMSAICWAI
ncbi:hypothetical protein ACSSNL_09060 [Thalassobius sp. S69A]